MRAPPASLILLAHDLRLSWRGLVDFVTRAGGRREYRLLVTVAVIVLLAHAVMYGLLKATGAGAMTPDALAVKLTVVFCLLFAAALDSATYALFSRGDYDLLFSAPVDPRHVFAVRFAAILSQTATKIAIYGAPFINVMVLIDGPWWLLAYPAGFGLVILAATLAVAAAMALMHILGLKRTRIAAQLTAALSGLSVFLLFRQDAPDGGFASPLVGLFVLPAKAMLGDVVALAVLLAFALAAALATAAALSGMFVGAIVAAFGRLGEDLAGPTRKRRRFVTRWPWTLVIKEQRLILRDSWLLSQVAMQCLYLVPAAGAVLASSGRDDSAQMLLPAILSVLAGQIAGSLTWIAISAEDAPELIAVAPVAPSEVLRAKILAVLSLVALVIVPLTLALAVISTWAAAVALAGSVAGAVSAVLINRWYANAARKKDFMRRRASSSILVNALETAVLLGVGVTAALAAHQSVATMAVGFLVFAALFFLSQLAPASADT